MDHHGSWPILGSWPLGVPAICCQASKCERTRPGPRLRQETHGTWPNVGVLFNFVLLNHLCDAGKHRARMNLNNTHSNCRTCQSPLTVLVLPMVLGIITYSHLFLVTGGLDNAGPPVSKSSTTLPMFECRVMSSQLLAPVWLIPDAVGCTGILGQEQGHEKSGRSTINQQRCYQNRSNMFFCLIYNIMCVFNEDVYKPTIQ